MLGQRRGTVERALSVQLVMHLYLLYLLYLRTYLPGRLRLLQARDRCTLRRRLRRHAAGTLTLALTLALPLTLTLPKPKP